MFVSDRGRIILGTHLEFDYPVTRAIMATHLSKEAGQGFAQEIPSNKSIP
jgi:hypothetical protein